jgi:ankyrin repeat protein
MNREWKEATQSGDLDRVAALLDAGADINSLDEHGQSALMNAVYSGDIELSRLLIERGAELNHTAKYRLTALMLAVINNHPEIVRLLVDAGADMQIKGTHGQFNRTPLEYAQACGYTAIETILRSRS